MALQTQKYLFRGATAYWSTTFTDVNGNQVNPISANIELNVPNQDGSRATLVIAMTAPLTGFIWTAQFDTRTYGTGPVFWSINTPGSAPVAVEDGSFVLVANIANVPVF